MATATEVISRLADRGVTFQIEDSGGLRINGISRLSERERAALKAHKSAILKALAADSAVSADPASPAPVEASLAVTAALPSRIGWPEPAPKDRHCYQCGHFQRSPYGYPLGLCAEHGLPEGLFSDVRGNRIQHGAGRPAQFGCISFQLRAPDTDVCTVCRHYHADSTMCHVVNVGCPLPHIPPCSGAHFEAVEVAL